MSVQVNWSALLTISETLIVQLPQSDDPVIVEQIVGSNGEFTSATTPAVTEQYSDNLDLVAGTVTIDLTALDKGTLPDLDATGLKVQFIKIKADPTNTGTITAKPAAVNGYDLFGATGEQVLAAGAEILINANSALDAVGAADKDIDVTSSDADAKLKIQLVFG